MTDLVINVQALSKQYRIGVSERSYDTLREAIVDSIVGPILKGISLLNGYRDKESDGRPSIWALKDVSFEIRRGEVVGIIGRNGAGKSTLLKILSQITEPSEGIVDIYGRVGSLLEVGTGFHPELTGRENIYLNGAILGMKKGEIDKKFNEIVEFSEVGKFIDTAVKHYSSGMYLRLAFGVAAHMEPEILIIDEVLAVGDSAFQKKCLWKMEGVAREGRTVLFVSHNMLAVQSLCQRVIWLDEGRVVLDGSPSEVVTRYLETGSTALTEREWNDLETAPGNDQVRIRRAAVRPLNGSATEPITIRTPFVMEFEFWNLDPGASLNLTIYVYNNEGAIVFATAPIHEPVWNGRPFPIGLFQSMCHVPGDFLNDGTHRVHILVVKSQRTVIFRQADILVFDVSDAVEMRGSWYGKWPGVCRPKLAWVTELLSTDLPVSCIRSEAIGSQKE
jgi:lipopolysaccharide transport system ATP-binding protein